MSINDIKNWTPEHVVANESICKHILEDPNALNQIPIFDNAPLHDFVHKQLVRFRGMIQDMYNPEYYFEKYEVKDTETGRREVRCGMYMDSAECLAHEQIILESNENKNSERRAYVVISIPGLNTWAKEKRNILLDNNKATVTNNCEYSKRNLEEEDCLNGDNTGPSNKKLTSDEANVNSQNNGNNRSLLSKDHILNFPISIDNGKACIVKIYDESNELKLNDIVEVVGFVSLDGTPCVQFESDEMMDDMERNTHEPPHSLVPRLHAIKVLSIEKVSVPRSPQIISNAQSIRGDLHIVLSQLLFGDHLAADYLICHLLSSVYLRKDYLNLGSFPLNLTNFPIEKYETFPKELYNVLTLLVEKSHLLELTLSSLNDLALTPKKDYDCDRLTSGILQLSNNTHLVIDETKLTSGQVSQHGRENYNTLASLIKFQKIEYDFKFYKMEFQTDIPVLILSQVKSFIPCPTRIVLKIDAESENTYPEIIAASKQFLKDEIRLNNIREYLYALRHAKFEISNDITDAIQEDFVRMRQADKSITEDNLHNLMVLARLMSLSSGINSLTPEIWKKAVQMEEERRNRLPR